MGPIADYIETTARICKRGDCKRASQQMLRAGPSTCACVPREEKGREGEAGIVLLLNANYAVFIFTLLVDVFFIVSY